MKGSKEEIKAIDLRSDYKVNPIGMHNVAPRLSWENEGVWKKPQTECLPDFRHLKRLQILRKFLFGIAKKFIPEESVNISYKGKPLLSRERVYWKVRIWDEKENVSEWSDEAFFELVY